MADQKRHIEAVNTSCLARITVVRAEESGLRVRFSGFRGEEDFQTDVLLRFSAMPLDREAFDGLQDVKMEEMPELGAGVSKLWDGNERLIYDPDLIE